MSMFAISAAEISRRTFIVVVLTFKYRLAPQDTSAAAVRNTFQEPPNGMTWAIGKGDGVWGDIGLAIIVSAALAAFSILVHFAVTHRNITLLFFLAVGTLFSIPLFPLFIAILAGPFEIAASLSRTKIRGALRSE